MKVIPENVLRQYCAEMMQDDIPLKHRAFFFTALTTGARNGEICGLSWDDIDFEDGSITINDNSQVAEDGSIIFVEPKTSASKRSVRLSPSVVQMLKDLRQEQRKQQLTMGQNWKHNPEIPEQEYCENHDKCSKECKGYCAKHCSMFKSKIIVFHQNFFSRRLAVELQYINDAKCI